MNLIETSLKMRRDLGRLLNAWLRPWILDAEKNRRDINEELKQHWPERNFNAHELILEDWDESLAGSGGSTKRPWPQFVVFIDEEYDIDWFTDGSLTPEACKSVSEAEAVGARRCKHLPTDQLLEFRRLVGLGIVEGIRGNATASAKLIREAARFLKARTIERSRCWTLSAAHILICVCSASLWIVRGLIEPLVAVHARGASLLLLTIQSAILGAYLSVLRMAGKGAWDAASGRWVHFLEVLTKIAAGSVCGTAAFMLTRSAHTPLSIQALGVEEYSLFLFGLGVGLFERLIPKMVSAYVDVDESKKES